MYYDAKSLALEACFFNSDCSVWIWQTSADNNNKLENGFLRNELLLMDRNSPFNLEKSVNCVCRLRTKEERSS